MKENISNTTVPYFMQNKNKQMHPKLSCQMSCWDSSVWYSDVSAAGSCLTRVILVYATSLMSEMKSLFLSQQNSSKHWSDRKKCSFSARGMYVMGKRPGLIKTGEVVTHLNYETQQARPGLSDDCKEIQPVHPKGNQSWVFTGRMDVEAETPIFWPRDAKSWLIWKDPHVGKDWGQEEKGTIEDEMVGWHHQLNGHEFG